MALTSNSDLTNLLTEFEILKAEVASLDEKINEYKVLELEDSSCLLYTSDAADE